MDITQKRNYTLDVARIVAVLAVVMIHCCGRFVAGYKLFTTEFIMGNLFDSLSRFGVPLFLMISGALFLDERKEVSIKNILSKNVRSLAIITIIWAIIYAVVYYVLFPYSDNKPINIKSVLNATINGHYHMWYLYMIMGLYCITPFLKRFVTKENAKMVLFFIGVSLLVTFLPNAVNMACKLGLDVALINTVLKKFRLEFFGGYITYFLTGWYIVHIGLKQKILRYLMYFLGLISLACIFLYVHFTGDHKQAYADIGILNYLYSVSLFLAISNIKINFNKRADKIVVNLSKLSFGVYIIHPMFLTIYDRVISLSGHSAVQIVVKFTVAICASFLSSYIISKIPLVKKLIKA